MKYDIIKIALAGVLLTGAASCSDFLNRPAEDTYNVSNFYQNDDQCIQGVNYLYNSPWYDFQRAFLWVAEVMSGNLYMSNSQYLDLSVNGTDVDLVNMSYSRQYPQFRRPVAGGEEPVYRRGPDMEGVRILLYGAYIR